MDILNNILDKTHNYLILVEARNTGLIALNLGLLSFYYNSLSHLKIIVLILCLLSILILAISFINFNFRYKVNEIKTNEIDNNACEGNEGHISKNNDILGVGSKAIKRSDNDDKIKENQRDLNKNLKLNIYNIKDIVKLNPKQYLNLVSNKMEVKGDKLLNFIKKDYRYSSASIDLSEEILMTARMCGFREKIFYITIYMFIANILILMIDNIIL
ncbi:hypothetical protein [Clostridium lacusfryxellense]|uniref:hypothetical protein n=1 Tax=Clostridium lacusfryxellense TaxID=205328 RepID=UPI001C0B29EA|nr:hypothetical protein [Clostridium lacusfryxellense]MBU3112751.1 hypothetical protein [Clostridium lacusfryxellense]